MRKTVDEYKGMKAGQAGYTLLEMAIIMLILSLIAAAAIPLYERYREKSQYQDTKNSVIAIDFALQNFRDVRGRFPCPAPYNLRPGQTGYGKEADCSKMTFTPGTCTGGLCFEKGARDVTISVKDGSGKYVSKTVTPLVIRGALPFGDLGLKQDESIDPYGGRYSYAVTQVLTDRKTFDNNAGAIDIVDDADTPNSLVDPEKSAQYFVFSHGKDNIGAYSINGDLISECKGTMQDNENCNTSSTHPNARYRYTLGSTQNVDDINASSTSTGTSSSASKNLHFDDKVSYIGIGRNPLWELGETNDKKATDTMSNRDIIVPKVTFGTDQTMDPTDTSLNVNVVGDVKVGTATASNTKVKTLCDSNNKNCMESAVLAAPDITDPRALKCSATSAGDAPSDVTNNKITCIVPVTALKCPPNQFLSGVTDKGTPLCSEYVAPATCNPLTKNICGTNKTLPGGAAVNAVGSLTGGASYVENYKCTVNPGNNTLADWIFQGSSGLCTCTPGIVTKTQGCGANMTGSIVTETTTTCPNGQQTTTTKSNTCTCVPSSTSATQNCPANFNGNITNTTTVTCDNNVPKVTTTQTANTCACVVNTKTQQVNCPSGFTGKINQTSTSQCPSGAWGNWTNTSNTCNCRAPYKNDKACPAGYNVGKITETCTYNCNNSNLTSSLSCQDTSNTCACQPSEVKTKVACPSGYTGEYTRTTKTTCPNAVTTTTDDKDVQCRLTQSACTVTATEPRNYEGTLPWRHGQVCTYTILENKCSAISACTKLQGNKYFVYDCKCI